VGNNQARLKECNMLAVRKFLDEQLIIGVHYPELKNAAIIL